MDMKLRRKVEEISGASVLKCMRCGKCSATCPNYDEMEYHPHEFVYMVEKGEVEKLMESKSIFTCLSCMACVERCPRQVEPAKIIEAVKLIKIRRQGENHLKPEQVAQAIDEELPAQAITSAFRKYAK
ncbi:MAG: 4Fe-4S dicluster domain-containing protein [Clostridia bacterium]|nr:4Fe-4S dicluster domain-containing protein [Clostridia bacterium]